jgi:hypothetical protein
MVTKINRACKGNSVEVKVYESCNIVIENVSFCCRLRIGI